MLVFDVRFTIMNHHEPSLTIVSGWDLNSQVESFESSSLGVDSFCFCEYH